MEIAAADCLLSVLLRGNCVVAPCTVLQLSALYFFDVIEFLHLSLKVLLLHTAKTALAITLRKALTYTPQYGSNKTRGSLLHLTCIVLSVSRLSERPRYDKGGWRLTKALRTAVIAWSPALFPSNFRKRRLQSDLSVNRREGGSR